MEVKKLPKHGKNLRCGICKNRHIKFWLEDALPLLQSMECVRTSPRDRPVPPSLKNWNFTIKKSFKK